MRVATKEWAALEKPQAEGICGNCAGATCDGVEDGLARMYGPRVRVPALVRICEPEASVAGPHNPCPPRCRYLGHADRCLDG